MKEPRILDINEICQRIASLDLFPGDIMKVGVLLADIFFEEEDYKKQFIHIILLNLPDEPDKHFN